MKDINKEVTDDEALLMQVELDEQNGLDLSGYADQVQAATIYTMRAAERKAKDIITQAELRVKNHARHTENARAAKRKARNAQKYQEKKEFHNQLGVSIEVALQQFCQELQGLSLVEVGQLYDQGAVARRRQQLAIIKETMAMITMLIKLQDDLAEKYNLKVADIKEGRQDNVVLLKHAQKLMKKAGA